MIRLEVKVRIEAKSRLPAAVEGVNWERQEPAESVTFWNRDNVSVLSTAADQYRSKSRPYSIACLENLTALPDLSAF